MACAVNPDGEIRPLLVDATGHLITNAAGAAATLAVKDEGSTLDTAAESLDFVGAGVTASGTGAAKTITIPGGAAPSLIIKDEGGALDTAAESLDFVGAGVVASGAGAAKTITIAGAAAAALVIKDEGEALATPAESLDFVGAGVVASGAGAAKTITIAGGGGSPITVENEGTPLATAAETLDFVGAGVTASGAGAEKTITISGDLVNDTTPDLGGPLTVGDQHILLSSAPTASKWSGIAAVFTAHEAFTIGKIGFVNADGEIALGDADAIASAACIAMATASISADATGVFLLFGFMHLHGVASWTKGAKLYLSETPGIPTSTVVTGSAGVSQIVGVATAADTILFYGNLAMAVIT
jgi:hypothetical protein